MWCSIQAGGLIRIIFKSKMVIFLAILPPKRAKEGVPQTTSKKTLENSSKRPKNRNPLMKNRRARGGGRTGGASPLEIDFFYFFSFYIYVFLILKDLYITWYLYASYEESSWFITLQIYSIAAKIPGRPSLSTSHSVPSLHYASRQIGVHAGGAEPVGRLLWR